jgi:hypothetical protein
MHRLTVAVLVVLACACGGASPEERAAMAKLQFVLTEPGATCQNLGAVAGSFRLQAVRLGANTVRLDAPTSMSGTAFFCPAPAAPRAETPILQP